jgi:glycosyltransferase involved in cell wall biosynthesis
MDDPEPAATVPRSAPTISVVVPAHNAGRFLADQLESLCGQDYQGAWEVVVVDNRSTDDTVAFAQSFERRLRVRVVPAPEKASAGYARNVGVGAATGDLIVFVDADDVTDPSLLSAYVARSGEYRVMGGHLDDFSSLNDPAVASWRYSLTADGLPVTLDRYPFALTSNMAAWRDVFDEIGLFDDTLEYFGEDTDLSIRASLAGIEIGWDPEAVVHYRHRNSLRTLVRQQFVYGRGSVVLYDRYRAVAGPRRAILTSVTQGFHLAVGVPNLVRGRARRGQWLAFAGYVAGQLVQSLAMRIWYVG